MAHWLSKFLKRTQAKQTRALKAAVKGAIRPTALASASASPKPAAGAGTGRGRPPKRVEGPPVPLVGDGSFEIEAVGESRHQAELAAICGPVGPEGGEALVRAQLVPEPDNPHDPFAIAVTIDGRTVGYLDRETARDLHAAARDDGLAGRTLEVDAQVGGGRLRKGGERGPYGVTLDLVFPLEPV